MKLWDFWTLSWDVSNISKNYGPSWYRPLYRNELNVCYSYFSMNDTTYGPTHTHHPIRDPTQTIDTKTSKLYLARRYSTADVDGRRSKGSHTFMHKKINDFFTMDFPRPSNQNIFQDLLGACQCLNTAITY